VCAFGDATTMWHSDKKAMSGVDLEMVSEEMRPVLAAMVGEG
jgi:hypothetical protein